MLSQVERHAPLGPDDLPEFLSAIAEAPDFHAASGFLLEQLAEEAGSDRALMLAIDSNGRELRVVRSIGFAPAEADSIRISLDAEGHPFVVCAFGLELVLGERDPIPGLSPPLDRWVAIPLPQPQFRGSPPVRQDRTWTFDARFGGCRIVATSAGERRRRFGRSPFAMAVIEGQLSIDTVDELVNVALLSGPILARTFSVDELQRSTSLLDDQRGLLTTIIDALPDPIVMTDGANNLIVQNTRAEHLLAFGEDDSPGRRRALEINNLLFSSFLSKAVMAGGVQTTGREMNLVDPDDGTDLLFEVLGHPLPSSVARDGAYLSVLRDVTDLKRASGELERQFQRLRLTESDATRERDRLNMILNNVGDPILVTDDQSKIILMNPQAERLFDLPNPAAVDRNTAQRVRGNDTKFTTLISDFSINPTLYRREQIALVQPESGIELPVEVVSGKIMNERGEPMAIVSVLHDLTNQAENERLYEALKQLNAELEGRIRMATADLEGQNLKLQWQSSELEKAYRLKSEFLANMSH
ncbi:MAG: PAS domain S-box protein, partial [Gemmatimonadota bacterium]|nr:PAS domain S-box protein [Gemmatimonadota bacterium]